jgi:N-sulfoglucosamine sulfohydrolase
MTQLKVTPDVLLVHCHDLGQFLGCYGLPTVRTPNLDAFAREGVLFKSSFCTAPQCSPSRAALFTGRYPHSTGVLGLTHANFKWDLNPDEKHIAQILRGVGYTTSAVGVLHEARSGVERCGFDNYAKDSRAKPATDAAIERLQRFARDRRQPFYMQVGFFEPHRGGAGGSDYLGFLLEGLAPDASLGVTIPGYLKDTNGARDEFAELQGAVHEVDVQMGRLLSALRETGLEQNTLVLFTTDHGIAMPRAKCTLYDPGIEVASILRLPARVGWNGGRIIEQTISNIDHVPAILELADVAPHKLHGRSYAPLLDGREYTARSEIFAEQTYHGEYLPMRCVRTEQFKLILNFAPGNPFYDCSQSLRPRSETCRKHPFHTPVELYELQGDRWENNNVAEDPRHASVLQELLSKLGQHMRETEDPLLTGIPMSPMHRQVLTMMGSA